MPTFVDTNVLVYAEDVDAGPKHEIARDLVLRLWDEGDGVVSIQVLQELYVTLTRKVQKPISASKAREIVEEYLTWRVVENTSALLRDAMHLQARAKLSFWDALVVQAAIDYGCERLLSEDLNDGQRLGALEIENPFEPRG